jgi:hypothetical protein
VDESPDRETMLAASEEFYNRRKTLSDALTVLNDRERRIFETRRLSEDPITLAELAEEFSVSRERVRQIEVRAFEKVQNAVKHRVARHGERGDSAIARRGEEPWPIPWRICSVCCTRTARSKLMRSARIAGASNTGSRPWGSRSTVLVTTGSS